MRKLMIAICITGWAIACVLWYGGHQVTVERDRAWYIAESLQLRLQLCSQEKAIAQSALQGGCFRGESL
jgi:hypothetical protein